jgi:hypothetical protein
MPGRYFFDRAAGGSAGRGNNRWLVSVAAVADFTFLAGRFGMASVRLQLLGYWIYIWLVIVSSALAIVLRQSGTKA